LPWLGGAQRALAFGIAFLPFTQTVGKGGWAVKERKNPSGAARLAWDMFEKTGSIAYYMLFLELNKHRHY
jgi:hypothetical protein